MPIGRRSVMSTSIRDGSVRRSVAASTHGEASSRCCQSSIATVRMLLPGSPSRIASTSPVESRALPCTLTRVTVSAGAPISSAVPRQPP